MAEVTAVILAAGMGTRMKSDLIKVLHPIGGKPMLGHVISNVRAAGVERLVAVVGHQAESVQAAFGDSLEYALQTEQLGTGHALLQTEHLLAGAQGDLLLLYGDNPFVGPEILTGLLEAHRQGGAAATVLTAEVADPTGLGRIIRNHQGDLARIVEQKDASESERQIREINTGIYCFKLQVGKFGLFELLHRLEPNNAQKEYYLTDIVGILNDLGERVAICRWNEEESFLAPNNRRQFAEAEALLRKRTLDRLMDDGVSIIDPATTYVDAEAQIGRDTVLYPFTFIQGPCVIGEKCQIGPHSRLVASRVADGARITESVVEESSVGPECQIGPYSHLRPGCELGRGVQVGNYAELKKAKVADGVKCHHHSYLGDIEIGAKVNIGAGVITSNYDGVHKHRTEIGAGAFIGTNVNLVAPIKIGENSFIAAGSTVNRDVPADALAIARNRQDNKEGYAARLREKKQK